MARRAIGFVLGLALALAACGGRDEVGKSAREAREATEVTVESAPQAGAPTGEAAREATQVTVESAKPGDEAAED